MSIQGRPERMKTACDSIFSVFVGVWLQSDSVFVVVSQESCEVESMVMLLLKDE